MATYSLRITPDTIAVGGSAQLQWDVEEVKAVYLDGQGVTGHETRSVSPAVSTTYTLRVVLRDETNVHLTATLKVENAEPIAPDAPHAPTVRIAADNLERIKRYPRPADDNGRGLHFHIDLRDQTIAKSVARLRQINAKWTLIYAPDELQAGRAAKACWQAGIMPVVRIGKKIDEFADPKPYVDALMQIGAPPYVQIFNEPSDDREWLDPSRPNRTQFFADHWAKHAAEVSDAGGFPGLQVLSKDELDAAIDAVKASNRQRIWERAFFVVHNYALNHPPEFPYDTRNQQDRPGQTIVGDTNAALSFLAFARWMQERLGFVLPIIGGEGGWQYDNGDDRRYPRIQQTLHAQYHRQMFEWFRTGVLATGEPLPDYLFSITPWLLGGWGTSEDWWDGPLGPRTETIQAVQSIPAFVRHFSWETAPLPDDGHTQPTPEPEPKPEPETKPSPVPTLHWDARLDLLGVRLVRSGQSPAWRLISADYLDPMQSGNRIHVDITALKNDGTPAQGVKFLVDWVGRKPDEDPGFPVTDAQGLANFPIFTLLHPAEKDGKNFATALDQPSDRVEGMGLPFNHHVCYELTFRFGE